MYLYSLDLYFKVKTLFKISFKYVNKINLSAIRYISKDILDKYKTIDKVYVLKVCQSRKKQTDQDKKLMQYFTYGKFQEEIQEENDLTHNKKKTKSKPKRNNKPRTFIGRNERRGSKVFNTIDAKCISDVTSKRK